MVCENIFDRDGEYYILKCEILSKEWTIWFLSGFLWKIELWNTFDRGTKVTVRGAAYERNIELCNPLDRGTHVKVKVVAYER